MGHFAILTCPATGPQVAMLPPSHDFWDSHAFSRAFRALASAPCFCQHRDLGLRIKGLSRRGYREILDRMRSVRRRRECCLGHGCRRPGFVHDAAFARQQLQQPRRRRRQQWRRCPWPVARGSGVFRFLFVLEQRQLPWPEPGFAGAQQPPRYARLAVPVARLHPVKSLARAGFLVAALPRLPRPSSALRRTMA